MKYKFLAIDLDGTLTNSKKEVTEYTCRILRRYIEAGGNIILASGRPTYGVMPIAERLELKKRGGYILSYNGGVVFDCKTEKTFFCQNMPLDAKAKLYKFAKENKLSILTYRDNYIITETPVECYTREEAFITKMKIRKVNNFIREVNYPVVKFLLTGEPDYVRKMEKLLIEMHGDEYTIARSAPYFLEVQMRGIDKGKTLKRVVKLLGATLDETVVFGDSYNDLSMLRNAGLSVAMENGVEVVKKIADIITRTNEDNGVAVVVEEMLNRKLVVFNLSGIIWAESKTLITCEGIIEFLQRLKFEQYIIAVYYEEKQFDANLVKQLRIKAFIDEIKVVSEKDTKKVILSQLLKKIHPLSAVVVGNTISDCNAAEENHLPIIRYTYDCDSEDRLFELYKMIKKSE